MARSLIAIAALLGLLAAAVPTLAARELKQDIEGDCTVTLGGGLDPLAGHTDLTVDFSNTIVSLTVADKYHSSRSASSLHQGWRRFLLVRCGVYMWQSM